MYPNPSSWTSSGPRPQAYSNRHRAPRAPHPPRPPRRPEVESEADYVYGPLSARRQTTTSSPFDDASRTLNAASQGIRPNTQWPAPPRKPVSNAPISLGENRRGGTHPNANRVLAIPPKGPPPSSTRSAGTRRPTQWDYGRENANSSGAGGSSHGERERPDANRRLEGAPKGERQNSVWPAGMREPTQWDYGRERDGDGDQRDRSGRDRPNANRVLGSRGMIEF